MEKFRIILFPLALIYAFITQFRNWLYDRYILPSVSFDIPVINVGNLSMGGTGKTPQIEYLIRLLQKDFKVAVVSRGYKRKTKGFIIADASATARIIGDEPFQIFKKFQNIIVAVGENRVHAVQKLMEIYKPDVILLDDAFQHRRISAGLNLLLTPFDKAFFKDLILPAGNLRECRSQAKRADILMVTKSPPEISSSQKKYFFKKIKNYTDAPVFFSQIKYGDKITGPKNELSLSDIASYKVLLITGIANPEPLYSFLSEKNINFDSLKFGDHHVFSKKDIKRIKTTFEKIKNGKKLILTTEKDYVRLNPFFEENLYYLPIQTQVFENESFNKKILNYVSNK